MNMRLLYDEYLDRIYGGWLGKCIGGTIGDRFECNKTWIDIAPEDLFPDEIPPNDDLDLQMLWLKVLEEKGSAFRSEDLAEAWLEGCWYPFNEYGVFKRNWRLGIAPPTSGSFGNPSWNTGMGCPIRSEIWGYVCPGNPDLAAQFAYRDGTLDHTEQSVGAEQMWAAMAALAFVDHDINSLIERTIHYLPKGTPIARLSDIAIKGYRDGRPQEDVRLQILANSPTAEACDSQINVPFTLLGLLYGEGDLQKTLIKALNCGYDTDCTMATAGALVAQIMGAEKVPAHLRDPIGDKLVMGIQYKRPDMTVSGIARDTARIGVIFGEEFSGNIRIEDAPSMAPLQSDKPGAWSLSSSYKGLPCAAPGDTVCVEIKAEGALPEAVPLMVQAPDGWDVLPRNPVLDPLSPGVVLECHMAPDVKTVPAANRFTISSAEQSLSFGIKGADCWKALGVFFETTPVSKLERWQKRRRNFNNFIDPEKEYLGPHTDGDEAFREYSKTLGRPAVLPVRELKLEPERIIPLETAWCAYVERVIESPSERDVILSIGNNVPITVWMNGEEVGRDAGKTQWHAETTTYSATLQKGINRLRVKLTRIGAPVEFSCVLKDMALFHKGKTGVHCYDYTIDTMDVNPLLNAT